MSRPRVAVRVCSLALVFLIPAHGREPEQKVARIAKTIQVESDSDGLENALHIRKRTGRVELNRQVGEVRLNLAFYRGGKKIYDENLEFGVDRGAREVSFSIYIIDLDYLPLQDGKQGHSRIVAGCRLGGTKSERTFDLPKSVFDCSDNFGGSSLTIEHGSDTTVPLFTMFVLKGLRVISSGDTVDQIVRENSAHDLMIATLILPNRDPQ